MFYNISNLNSDTIYFTNLSKSYYGIIIIKSLQGFHRRKGGKGKQDDNEKIHQQA